MPAILKAGSTSYSHLWALCARYRGALEQLNVSAETQSDIVRAVTAYWRRSSQVGLRRRRRGCSRQR